jgi:hypothetical protein
LVYARIASFGRCCPVSATTRSKAMAYISAPGGRRPGGCNGTRLLRRFQPS